MQWYRKEDESVFLLSVIPVFMGAEIASQSAINSRLKSYTQSPYVASTISFLVGAVFLMVLTLISGQSLGVSLLIIRTHPWWMWLGGVTAAFALTTNVILFPILGSIQTSVLPIAGQLFMSLVIDQFGLFHAPVAHFTWLKFGGVIALFIGMLLATKMLRVHDKFEEKQRTSLSQVKWQFLGLMAGILLAIQSAINGYLGRVLQSPVHGTMISFVISFVLLLLLSLSIHQPLKQGVRRGVHALRHEWWIGIGGLLGSSYVFLSAWLVPILGTGRVIIIALFGQLLFSALIDQFGWLHADKNSMTRLQFLGLLVMLAGTIIINRS